MRIATRHFEVIQLLDPVIWECFELFTVRTTELVLDIRFIAKMKEQRINELLMGRSGDRMRSRMYIQSTIIANHRAL